MLTEKSISFGHYLLDNGLITFKDIIEARILQMTQNSKLVELAIENGLITIQKKDRILALNL